MWKAYFGPLAQIVTVDVRPECLGFEEQQIAVRIGDQSDPNFLQSILDEFGPVDVVLDDGSHVMEHVKASFSYLYPRMARDAIYFVEDMHTAYWPAWGGGLRKPGTFIEEMKNMVDELNSDNPHNPSQSDVPIPSSAISRLTRGIHFYDSIVVIEKGEFVNKEPRSIPVITGQQVW